MYERGNSPLHPTESIADRLENSHPDYAQVLEDLFEALTLEGELAVRSWYPLSTRLYSVLFLTRQVSVYFKSSRNSGIY